MEIINASLHRSGTKSFHRWCVTAGLRSLHWPGPELDDAAGVVDDPARLWCLYRPLAAEVDAVSDLPVPLLLPQLRRQWPQAAVVIAHRPVAAWTRSVRGHIGDRDLSNLERVLYWRLTGRRARRLSEYSDFELAAAYRRHGQQVEAACGRSLIRLRVDDGDTGVVLAQALKIPPVPWPHVGDG